MYHSGGDVACAEARGVWKSFLPSSQVCCESKAVLKKNCLKKCLKKNFKNLRLIE